MITTPATTTPIAGHAHALLARRYKTWLVFVLFVVSVFNFADRAILAVLAQPIKEDLKLTDTDLGMLQGLGFAILYSVLGIPLGRLAERFSRKGIIAICVAAWSIMTAVCGFATSFVTLLLGRIGVGIGEAGFQPPTSSLVSDHFRADRRASILAIIALGSPIGFLVGQAFGGWVASQWNWRVAFFALCLPGLLSALLVWLTLREPPRGLAEGDVTRTEPPSFGRVIIHLWSKPAFRHLLIGWSVVGIGFNGIAQFVLPFYLRSFDLPLAVAGAAFGAVSFTSNGLGMLLSGFGFDWLSRGDMRWALWGVAAAVATAAPMYFGAFSSTHVWTSMAFIWVANFVLVSFFAPSQATFQNLAGPTMRASTTAIAFVAAGLIGAGLGPTVLGMASDLFAAHAFESAHSFASDSVASDSLATDFFASCPGGRAAPGAASSIDAACRAATTLGLRHALVTMLVFFVWAAVHYLLAARTLKQDLYRPSLEVRSAGGSSSPA